MTPNNPHQTCNTCMYFSRLWNSQDQYYRDEGVCKRFPPIVLLVALVKRARKSKVNGEYPHVRTSFGCSAWSERLAEGYKQPLNTQFEETPCETCPECKHCVSYQKIDDNFGRCRLEYDLLREIPELAKTQLIQSTKGDSRDRIVAREYWCGAFCHRPAAE
jgi:hypothetical protein